MTRRGLIGSAAAGLLQGCSPLSAFNALAPRPLGVHRTGDIQYGPLQRQRLDVYLPGARAGGAAPLLVFFYGGGWEGGDRAPYAFAGRAYAAKGFVTGVADYRVTRDAPFPAFLQDCALAVAWMQQHAAEFGADAGRTVVAGHSAGAYNAAMLALDRRWLAGAGATRPIAGWAGLSGPYAFLPLTPGPGQRTFGRVADAESTQPITFAAPGAPPAFLAHGDRDKVVSPLNAERLTRRLRADGVRVEDRVYPGAGHAETVLALAWPMSWRFPVLRDSAAFLHAAAAGALRSPASARATAS